MQLFGSDAVKEKLLVTHGVTFLEAEEAFNNFSGFPLKDLRAAHRK